MQIIYIHRREVHKRPPVITALDNIYACGQKTILITTDINNQIRDRLKEKTKQIIVIPFKISRYFWINAFSSMLWGIKAKRIIRKIASKEGSVLWIEGNQAIDSLGAKFINKYNHILQLQEMFEFRDIKGRHLMRTLKKVMPTAIACTSPEYNRSQIFRATFLLKTAPYVMYNKASFFPSAEELKILAEKYTDITEKINGRKVILYQGALNANRDLGNFVKATAQLNSTEYVTVLLGDNSSLIQEYQKINPDLIFIPYIPAPDYLYITSLAYIGVLSYAPIGINLIYCAPNKIFEYGAFGIPMLGNDLPGLRYTVEAGNMGKLCDYDNQDSVLVAIEDINRNYVTYSKNAKDYYDSIDNVEVVKAILANMHS